MVGSMTLKEYFVDHMELLSIVIAVIFLVIIALDYNAGYFGYNGTSSYAGMS
jgi:hypothetical protein